MGQAVKARKAVTQRRPKNIKRNSAHKNARKAEAQKNITKRNKSKSGKPPDNKSSEMMIEDHPIAPKKRSKKSRKKTTLNKQPKNKTTHIKNKKNVELQTPKIDFIMEHRADNILYYTQSCEDFSLFGNDKHDKSETPIIAKSFAPLPAVREPLSEYIILQKKRKIQQSHIDHKEPPHIKNHNAAIHIEDISDPSKPLPRSASLTVSNSGPLHILAYWLKTSRYKILNIFKREGKEAVKKRSKADILNELAGLRAENAMLRKKLNKKQMPFGRKKFDVQ